jgi:hypothetical protein
MVSQKNILPREGSTLERDMDVLGQANHRRSVNRQFFRVQDMAIMLLHSSYSLKDHHYGAPFGAHINGFKGSVQY